MNPSSRLAAPTATADAHPPIGRRNPQRITITLPWATHQALLARSDVEGRSLSNLAAHLIELELRPIA